MKKFYSYALIIVASILTKPLFAEITKVETEDKGIDRNPVYHIFADVDLVPTTDLQYAKPRVVIKSIIPKLTSETEDEGIDAYNNQVMDIINQEAKLFKNEVGQNAAYQQTLAKTSVKNDLTIDFDSSVLNTGETPIISIRFTVKGYISGLGHHYRHHRVMNYDFETGELLALADLFKANSNYLEIISDYSRNALEKKFKDHALVAQGTTPITDNFKNWNLNPSGIRITFDENQVAASKYGTQTVLIPYSALRDIIEEDTVVDMCLKHKTKCFRNNILTGGFLDEARNDKEDNWA